MNEVVALTCLLLTLAGVGYVAVEVSKKESAKREEREVKELALACHSIAILNREYRPTLFEVETWIRTIKEHDRLKASRDKIRERRRILRGEGGD
jgi:hypothetical protein